MVEKRQTGIAVQFSGAIEINGDADLRFVSVAFDARLTLVLSLIVMLVIVALYRFRLRNGNQIRAV